MSQPGWYPDENGVQRYWDGQRWLDPEPTQQPGWGAESAESTRILGASDGGQQQPGYDPYAGGYQQPGYNQGGFQQPGYQQGGYAQGGYQDYGSPKQGMSGGAKAAIAALVVLVLAGGGFAAYWFGIRDDADDVKRATPEEIVTQYEDARKCADLEAVYTEALFAELDEDDARLCKRFENFFDKNDFEYTSEAAEINGGTATVRVKESYERNDLSNGSSKSSTEGEIKLTKVDGDWRIESVLERPASPIDTVIAYEEVRDCDGLEDVYTADLWDEAQDADDGCADLKDYYDTLDTFEYEVNPPRITGDTATVTVDETATFTDDEPGASPTDYTAEIELERDSDGEWLISSISYGDE